MKKQWSIMKRMAKVLKENFTEEELQGLYDWFEPSDFADVLSMAREDVEEEK